MRALLTIVIGLMLFSSQAQTSESFLMKRRLLMLWVILKPHVSGDFRAKKIAKRQTIVIAS